jgi:hypothetical protein
MYETRSGTFMGAVVLAVGLVVATTIGGWFFVKGNAATRRLQSPGRREKESSRTW